MVGETGSGKSTQHPQYLLGARYAEAVECEVSNKIICVTEPRRIAVTSSREYTKIKFVTEGILIREMMGDPLLSNYSVIMLDEVHERTAQIDIIMGLLKNILKRHREIRLIIKEKNQKTSPTTILSVEGRNYNVDVFYLDNPCPDYVKGCVKTTIKIHEKQPPENVLVFLTGMEEVGGIDWRLRGKKN